MLEEELIVALDRAQEGTPEQSVESAVMIFLAAKAGAEKFESIQAQAKKLIGDVMAETGQTTYRTKAGSVSVSSAGQSVSYDHKALDALCQSMPDLAAVLAPHRKVTERAGSLRVVAGK